MNELRSALRLVGHGLALLSVAVLWVASVIHLTKWLGCLGVFLGLSLFLVGAVTFPFIYWAVEEFELAWFVLLALGVGGVLLVILADVSHAPSDSEYSPASTQGRETAGAVTNMLYESAKTRANWAYVGLGLYVAAAAFNILATLSEIDLLQRIDAGEYVSLSEAETSDGLVATAGLLVIASVVGATIAFCSWIHRANRNLRAVTEEPIRFSPGWSVGWFFVPIMNLFRPYQVMNEIHRHSHAQQRSSPLLGIWWGLWLVGGYVGWAATRTLFDDSDLSTAITADWLIVISDVALIIAAVVVIVLIHRITSWQDGRLFGEQTAAYPTPTQAPSDFESPLTPASGVGDSDSGPNTPAAAPSAPSHEGGIAERLRELHRLRDEGLITDEQFEESRSRIIGEL